MHRPILKLVGRRMAAAQTPDELRKVVDRSVKLLPRASGVATSPATFGHLGGVRITPTAGAAGSRSMLLFHGGGYVFGSPEQQRTLAGRIAKAADATVYLPRHRLAPEHPHPAAIDDGVTAYRAMLDRVPLHDLVVGGDSAGGGLALAMLQRARHEGLPMPAGMVLISPWLDLTASGASYRTNADADFLLLPAARARATDWYRGDVPSADPAVSPLFGDMTGLPPTLVQVAAPEVLYSDSDRFVDLAREAGVDVTFQIDGDMWHVWHLTAPLVTEARHAIAKIGDFVAARTGTVPSETP